MDKWKDLIHRALLECQKIEHRQNNTRMIRIDEVISKINDFLKYRNDNGEFDEICEANSKGTKVSTLLTKEVLAALFAENMYICVEGKFQNFICFFLRFRINFWLYQGDISPSPRTTPIPTKVRSPEPEFVPPVSMPKRKQKVEPKFEPKFEEPDSENISEPEELYEHSSEIPDFIQKQNIWNAPFASDDVIKIRKTVKRWLFDLVRKFVKDKGMILAFCAWHLKTDFRRWDSFTEVGRRNAEGVWPEQVWKTLSRCSTIYLGRAVLHSLWFATTKNSKAQNHWKGQNKMRGTSLYGANTWVCRKRQ